MDNNEEPICGKDLTAFAARLREAEEGDNFAFQAPWQARAFAMTAALHERGLFAWPEWTDVFSCALRQSAADGLPDTNETYYFSWLTALETIANAKSLASGAVQSNYREAWKHACLRTRHGKPIELLPDDFPRADMGVEASFLA